MFTNNNAEYILENNKKLERLIDKLESENQHIFWGDKSTNLTRDNIWLDIKSLLIEQNELFKKTSYFQTVKDRNTAWNEFRALQDRAYYTRRNQREEYSDQIFDEISEVCSDAEDFSFFGFYTFEPKNFDDLREKSSKTKEAWNLFKEKKFSLTKEKKDELYQRLTRLSEELSRNWDDYNRSRSQRNDDRRERLIEVLDKKNVQLENSKDFLEKLYDKKFDIESNISSDCSNSYRERLEDRLEGLEDKINEVENQIDALEESIQDLQDKINRIT